MSIDRLIGYGSVLSGTGRNASLALLAAAALAVAGCQPAAQDGGEGEAAGGEEMAPAVSSEEVIAMERGLWEALSQGDYQGFAEQIADDVTLVGGDGISTKQDMMGMLEGSTVESYELTDFQVMQPGSGVAVVTYHYSEMFRPADADSAVSQAGWATSMWEDRDGTWMTVFHQSSSEPASME